MRRNSGALCARYARRIRNEPRHGAAMTARKRAASGADILRYAAEAREQIAIAERDAAVSALADVMRLLRASAGSPHEQQVMARAREVLALSGRVESAEIAQYQAAYEEWERRRR